MATVARTFHLILEPEHIEVLDRLAADEQTTPEAVAEQLLRRAIDQRRFKPGEIEAILDSIPGFYERYQESLAQARDGRTIPLSDLRRK